MTAIIKIEDVLSGMKRKGVRMHLLVLVIAFAVPLSAGAITKKNADDEYKKGNYQQAIKDYEELLKKNGFYAQIYNSQFAAE